MAGLYPIGFGAPVFEAAACHVGETIDPQRSVPRAMLIRVDDFGTGYSSLSYLHRLPIDMLKIDRSFVAEMIHNRESPQIVRTILRLADSLGMRVVAEGVETVEQMAEPRAFGCQFGQGYLFSRPLCEAGADAYIAQALQTGCIAADGRAA